MRGERRTVEQRDEYMRREKDKREEKEIKTDR